MEKKSLPTRRATIFLLLLSPITAELLSGSSPPVEFFNPIAFVMLVAFYGSGAVIMRELKIRWGKGYGSLLILGAAYGIIEEGLAVKSFFDPNWVDLGILGTYGRWLGVNWVWCMHLTIYHSVVSIVIPIVLTEIMYPEIRKESLITTKKLKILAVVFILDSSLLFAFLTVYIPPVIPYIATIIAVLILFYIAYRLPEYDSYDKRPPPSSKKLWAIGLSWIVIDWFIFYGIPYTGIHPIITIALGVMAFSIPYRYLTRFNWNNDIHKLSVISGVLSFLIFLAILQELFNIGPSNTTGMALVGIAYAVFLLYLYKKAKK